MLRNLNRLFLRNANHGSKNPTRFRNTIAKRITKRNRTVNPGVNLQMKVLNQNQPWETDMELDDLEADFMHLEMTHKEHVEQSKAMREQEKYLIVKQKYFKEKYPNFLTWSDKQQMRYLFNTHPEEWTIEKLSEGFPALPEIVSKIVTSSWTKTNPNKIKNHDASVQKNWKLFKEGKLELPRELTEHLKKFSDRKLNLESFNAKEIVSVREPVKPEGEFSQIIKSYERLKNNTETEIKKGEEESRKPQKETYTIVTPSNYEDKKMITLNELKNRIGEKVQEGKELTVDDELILNQKNSLEKEEHVNVENTIVDITQFKSSDSLQVEYKSKRDYKCLEYPEKIIIPKEKFKKGYTYKLNDCYYDSDGSFLYRVPGMEN